MYSTRTVPVSVITAKLAASIPSTTWVINSRRCGYRSAINPPNRPKNSIGPNCSAVVTPTANDEPVSENTSQSWAIRCIQVPLLEIRAPRKYNR